VGKSTTVCSKIILKICQRAISYLMTCKMVSTSKHTRKFWFWLSMPYPIIQPEVIVRMKRLYTGVTLPQRIAGAGSWRKQMEDVRMMKTVQMLFSVVRGFIVIAVESK
jgi:hypothetical protein